MEKTLKFNSQIATSRVQSERLFVLGLKKETADMMYECIGRISDTKFIYKEKPLLCLNGIMRIMDIPAWSLHRLLCLYNVHYLEFMGEKEITGAYDIVIDAITQAIEGGYFNEKYLV